MCEECVKEQQRSDTRSLRSTWKISLPRCSHLEACRDVRGPRCISHRIFCSAAGHRLYVESVCLSWRSGEGNPSCIFSGSLPGHSFGCLLMSHLLILYSDHQAALLRFTHQNTTLSGICAQLYPSAVWFTCRSTLHLSITWISST